jgi:preprotein translocase subunit SecY
MLAPSNFSFSTIKQLITFFLQQVDIRLHDQNGKITIEDLHRIVEDFVFDQLVLLIFLNVLCVNFGFAFHK